MFFARAITKPGKHSTLGDESLVREAVKCSRDQLACQRRSICFAGLALALMFACKSRDVLTASSSGTGSGAGTQATLPAGVEQDVKAIALREHATALKAKGTVQLARAWRYAGGPTLAAGRSWVAVETDFGPVSIDTDDLEAVDPDSKAVSPIGDVQQLDASGNPTSFGGARHYALFFDVDRKSTRLELRYWGETLSTTPITIAESGPEYPAAMRAVIRHFARDNRHVLLIEDHNQPDPPSSTTHHLTAGTQECALTGMLPVKASLALAEPSTEPVIGHAFYLADYTCPAPPDRYGVAGSGTPIPAAERMTIPAATLEALEGRGPNITVIPAQKVFTHVATDGTLLAIAPYDGAIRLVDPQGQVRTTLAGLSSAEVCGIGFAPDGKRVWSVQEDGLVLLWDVASGKRVAKTTLERPPSLTARPEATTDGRFLIIDHPWDEPDRRVGWSGQLRVLSLADLSSAGTIKIVKGDEGALKSFALASDGKSVLACASTEKTAIVRVHALPAGTVISTVKAPIEGIAACALTSDSRIVVGTENGDIQVYDRSGKLLGTATAHRGGTYVLQARDDGTFLSGGADGVVLLWPKRDDKLAPQPIARHKYPVIGLDALGSIVLSVSSNEAIASDVKTHAQLQRLHGSPDGPESTAMAPGIIAVSEMMMELKAGRVRIWHMPPVAE